MSNEQANNCCGDNAHGQFQKLDQILTEYQDQKGALIPVLQEAQNIYGYLSKEVIDRIGKKMAIPTSQIYGVATFYSQFHLKARGRNIIRVCQGTACHVRDAKTILRALEDNLKISAGETTTDRKFTLETVACIGACGLAPVLMVNDDTHGRLTPEAIPDILARYL
ncbi:MAG: NADH-quinone oxidoreductase, subunit [Firmicutes bacterium]|nr:NADH-quinone oxidoreductase, subunit [Bacillota bacterium]